MCTKKVLFTVCLSLLELCPLSLSFSTASLAAPPLAWWLLSFAWGAKTAATVTFSSTLIPSTTAGLVFSAAASSSAYVLAKLLNPVIGSTCGPLRESRLRDMSSLSGLGNSERLLPRSFSKWDEASDPNPWQTDLPYLRYFERTKGLTTNVRNPSRRINTLSGTVVGRFSIVVVLGLWLGMLNTFSSGIFFFDFIIGMRRRIHFFIIQCQIKINGSTCLFIRYGFCGSRDFIDFFLLFLWIRTVIFSCLIISRTIKRKNQSLRISNFFLIKNWNLRYDLQLLFHFFQFFL